MTGASCSCLFEVLCAALAFGPDGRPLPGVRRSYRYVTMCLPNCRGLAVAASSLLALGPAQLTDRQLAPEAVLGGNKLTY